MVHEMPTPAIVAQEMLKNAIPQWFYRNRYLDSNASAATGHDDAKTRCFDCETYPPAALSLYSLSLVLYSLYKAMCTGTGVTYMTQTGRQKRA